MRDALITIKGTQYINDQEDIIELKILGKFGQKNDKFYIKYSQREDGEIPTDTLIKVSQTQAILTRSGATDSRMVIEVGKRCSCTYSSGGAGLFLEVYGEEIENSLTQLGGKLILRYNLSANSAIISRNKTEITVKEV